MKLPRLSPWAIGAAAFGAVLLLARKAGDGGGAPPNAGPIRFVPAKNFGKGRQGHAINLIVIHTAETPKTENAAQNVADYFASTDNKVSSHYTVDKNQIVQSVADEDTAWHAAPQNFNSIGIEHAGYANQSPEEWAGDYSESMLRRSAALVGRLAAKYGIPVRRLSATELAAGGSGLASHKTVNDAFHKGDHTDPGPNFPWEHYLELVRGAANA